MKIKVNEKNMYAVMGKINTFFRKQTKRDLGTRLKYAGEKPITREDGTVVCVPDYYEDEYFEPFFGNCHEHWKRIQIREDMKNGKYVLRHDVLFMNKCLLAISDAYSGSCIPIMNGFVVEITGERLTIKENDVVNHIILGGDVRTIKNKDKSTYINFYHMPITYDEYQDSIRRGIHNSCSDRDGYYYAFDLTTMYGPNNYDLIRDAHNDLLDLLVNVVDHLDLTRDEYHERHVVRDKEIVIHININAFQKEISFNDDDFYIELNGNKYYDWLDVVIELISDEMFGISDDDDDDEFWD